MTMIQKHTPSNWELIDRVNYAFKTDPNLQEDLLYCLAETTVTAEDNYEKIDELEMQVSGLETKIDDAIELLELVLKELDFNSKYSKSDLLNILETIKCDVTTINNILR